MASAQEVGKEALPLNRSIHVQPYHFNRANEDNIPWLRNKFYANAEYMEGMRGWARVFATSPKIQEIKVDIGGEETSVFAFSRSEYTPEQLKKNIEKIGSDRHGCEEDPSLREQVLANRKGLAKKDADNPGEDVWLDIHQGFGFALTEADANEAVDIAYDQLVRMPEERWRKDFEKKHKIDDKSGRLVKSMLAQLYRFRQKVLHKPDLSKPRLGKVINVA